MMHRHCFEAVDRTMRDILRFEKVGNFERPFGGKVVVLGGDFRQILPVIPKGTRQQIVNSAINSSFLWNHCHIMTLSTNMRLMTATSGDDINERRIFSDWLIEIGDGRNGEHVDDEINLEVPSDLLIRNSGCAIEKIVDTLYPNFTSSGEDILYYQKRAILAPTNEIVDQINDYMLHQIHGEEVTYISLDTPHSDNHGGDRIDNVHSTEYLNTISSPGLPNHLLHLKVGVPVMLLRNIDQNAGLCNGTRLILTHLGKYVLEGRVISGSNSGDKVYIPRLSLSPSDVRIPFKFHRRQFPINISFAMTINKSQGQSLEYVGVYLPRLAFSHGQTYVAFSRVTSKSGLKVLITNEEDEHTNITKNVVYHEIFTNLNV